MVLLKRAFSTVSRERSSTATRLRAMPKLSNRRRARSDSLAPRNTSWPAPPENTRRAAGYFFASPAISVMRSAASLSAMSCRAPDTTESSAPPRATIPSGGRPPSCQGGKPAPGAREAGSHQHDADQPKRDGDVGRQREKAEDLGKDEEHRPERYF